MLSFTLSLAFHGLVFFFFTYLSQFETPPQEETPLEIVFTEPNRKNVFVQAPPPSTQTPKTPKKKKEVQFKSNETRRVELESWKRPEKVAPLQANLSSGGQGGSQKKEQKEAQETQETQENGDFVTENRKPLKLPGFGTNSGRPTIPTYVQERLPPGVRLGNVTALNTDQHRFYSFNQRLLSRFVPLWGEKVRRALYQWLDKNNAPAISKTWVTNVEVIMNQKGEILDVQPFRLSGLWSIDQSSIESFRQVKNVPNPPKEMVDENGYIHLQFQTEVIYVPRPGVRFHGGN